MARDRRLLLLTFLLGFVLLVSIVGPTAYTMSTQLVPESGGAYIEAVAGQPKYINPILSQLNSVDQDLVSLVFSGLTKVDERGEIVADLAKGWQVSDDGRVYTFELRDDVLWHDGQPFQADDVVFTIKALQDPNYQGARWFAELWQRVTVEKVDGHRVRFVLGTAFAPFLEYTTLGILPAHLLANVPAKALPSNSFNAAPIGAGPFKVKEANLEQVVLEANSNYYGQKPMLAQVVLRFYPDLPAAMAAFQRGEVRGTRYIASSTTTGGLQGKALYYAPEYSKLTLLLLNLSLPLFGEAALRQALAYGIDRDRIIWEVLYGQGEPAYGPISPNSWAYRKQSPALGYQPSKARALLESLGWRDNDGDGVREKDGISLAFELLTNDPPAERRLVAEKVARQLAAIGVKVEVRTVSWTTLREEFLLPRKFQAVLVEHWSPNVDPDSYQFWHSSQIGDGLNLAGWSNRAVDTLLERAQRTTNREDRAEMYRQFQAIFAEEVPSIPLYYPVYGYAMDQSVRGVRLGPLIEEKDRLRSISAWYVRTKRIIKPL